MDILFDLWVSLQLTKPNCMKMIMMIKEHQIIYFSWFFFLKNTVCYYEWKWYDFIEIWIQINRKLPREPLNDLLDLPSSILLYMDRSVFPKLVDFTNGEINWSPSSGARRTRLCFIMWVIRPFLVNSSWRIWLVHSRLARVKGLRKQKKQWSHHGVT